MVTKAISVYRPFPNISDHIVQSIPIGFKDMAEKKGTGRLFCEPIDGTCSGVLV